MLRPTLIDLNLTEDPFGRIDVPRKKVDVNLKVSNMIKWINESKAKHISSGFTCEFDGRKCSLRQKWNNDTC